MLRDNYLQLHKALMRHIPKSRLIHDDLRALAYGTDASFYRLIPKLVAKVETENEVIHVLREARAHKTPLTFRAAGTSLSGQSITDSVLVMLGPSWNKIRVNSDGSQITLQPGVIGSQANQVLRPFQRKIGPDPASINSAMIGGIAANNSSGMCCGTAQNSYKTLAGMRIILSDGSVLDTQDSVSRARFLQNHSELCSKIQTLAQKAKGDQEIAERIRQKFKMKNTTGYSLNALIDFEDPIEIFQHLMIGSEGTLGFIAEITYHTVPDYPFRATSLLLFPNIQTACKAVIHLKNYDVSAVELMDRASLHAVQNKEGMPHYLRDLDANVAALLVEIRSGSIRELESKIKLIENILKPIPKIRPVIFTSDTREVERLWNIRKGLFPSVGAMREVGTAVIIEDVVFPIQRLADAVIDLQKLFAQHGYSEAIIFGHALDGNLHFVFKQDFGNVDEVHRYEHFMNDLTHLVVKTYDGSLKAEHGTGRNMAPFVEMEWGAQAYQLMKEIKEIFDPEFLINPGVILNPDSKIHLKNLKPMPQAHPLVDKCIECGYCETSCPSKNLTLTPRQRIVVYREISRLTQTGENPQRLATFKKDFEYKGDATCATDGLCSMSCPVDIDTGKLVKTLRADKISPLLDKAADLMAANIKLISFIIRLGSKRLKRQSINANPSNPLKVVYFPSCISRTLGPNRLSADKTALPEKVESVIRKSGYEFIYPQNISNLCCGLAFSSRGFSRQDKKKMKELETALLEASEEGKHPILFDTSPCLFHVKESADFNPKLQIFEPIEFINQFLRKRLKIKQSSETITIHPTCSSQKLGLTLQHTELAQLCAKKVVMSNIGCCGFAGDRGVLCPELTASALRDFKESLPAECKKGFSTSTTCEMGLSRHSEIPYQSIFYLIDSCTEPLPPPA